MPASANTKEIGLFGCIAAIAAIVLIYTLLAWVFMTLWNHLAEHVFVNSGMPRIDIVGAAVIIALLSIVGGFFKR